MTVQLRHLLLASSLAAPGCARPVDRTEPPPAKAACNMAETICRQQPGPNLLDGTDPLWGYCHLWGMGYQPWGYRSGAAEFEWTYHTNGELDRVDMRCDDKGPEPDFAIVAERDATDRVVRWSYTTPMRDNDLFPPWDLVYDADGMLSESGTEYMIGTRSGSVANAFDYQESGNVREIETTETLDAASASWAWELEYDGDELARAAATRVDPCEEVREYAREDGRVTWMLQTAPCYINEGRREWTYEWSGDQVRRSHASVKSPSGNYTEETRYTYEDGRIAEVQRDRDGEPLATYWLDYDDEGRLTHLLWWGHQLGPEDMQP